MSTLRWLLVLWKVWMKSKFNNLAAYKIPKFCSCFKSDAYLHAQTYSNPSKSWIGTGWIFDPLSLSLLGGHITFKLNVERHLFSYTHQRQNYSGERSHLWLWHLHPSVQLISFYLCELDPHPVLWTGEYPPLSHCVTWRESTWFCCVNWKRSTPVLLYEPEKVTHPIVCVNSRIP